jgi:hypothetical protein
MEPMSSDNQESAGSVRSTDVFRLAVIRILGQPGGLDLLLKNPELIETIPVREIFRRLSEEDIARVMESPVAEHLVGERGEELIALLSERKQSIDSRLQALRDAIGERGKHAARPGL